jgi:hypothetical protein
MITPHDYNRIVFVRARIESIDHTTKHGIGKRDRRKIGLHGLLPLTMFANVLEVAIRTRAFPCGGKIRWGATPWRFESSRLYFFKVLIIKGLE